MFNPTVHSCFIFFIEVSLSDCVSTDWFIDCLFLSPYLSLQVWIWYCRLSIEKNWRVHLRFYMSVDRKHFIQSNFWFCTFQSLVSSLGHVHITPALPCHEARWLALWVMGAFLELSLNWDSYNNPVVTETVWSSDTYPVTPEQNLSPNFSWALSLEMPVTTLVPLNTRGSENGKQP